MAGLNPVWGYKFGCIWSMSFRPAQTGLCKYGWVCSSLKHSLYAVELVQSAGTHVRRQLQLENVCPVDSREPKVPTFLCSPPFAIKHPQDNFSLQNVNWHPPRRKSEPLKRDWRPPIWHSVWNYTTAIYILEGANLRFGGWNDLGVALLKRGTPQRGGTLGFPHWCSCSSGVSWSNFASFFGGRCATHWWCAGMISRAPGLAERPRTRQTSPLPWRTEPGAYREERCQSESTITLRILKLFWEPHKIATVRSSSMAFTFKSIGIY